MSIIIENALKRCSAAECFSLSKSDVEVEFDNNKLKGVNNGETSGKALRLVKDGKIGFATSTKKDDDEKLIKNALETAEYGREYDFEFTNSSDVSDVSCYNEKVEQVSVERMCEIGKEIVEAIREYDPDILAFASVGKGVGKVGIENSAGIKKEYKKSLFSVVGGGRLTEEGNLLNVYDFAMSINVVGEKEINIIKKKVIDDFKIAKINVPFSAGNYQIVLSPAAVGDLLACIKVCSNGKSVQKAVSPWRDKIGEKIFDSRINIYDDGTIADGVGLCPFDDEGVPTSKTKIIEKGVLKGFYHNLATASSLKMPLTGNGMRGRNIENVPAPASTNLVMTGGDKSVKNLFGEVKDGIFIDHLLGTFTSNHLAGQVSGNISLGYKIENGVLTGRIKDAMFALNVFEALQENLIGLSRETFWRGSVSTPYLLLDDIYVSAKK